VQPAATLRHAIDGREHEPRTRRIDPLAHLAEDFQNVLAPDVLHSPVGQSVSRHAFTAGPLDLGDTSAVSAHWITFTTGGRDT
jgi:hypothetical protein